MCGIAGIVRFDPGARVASGELEAMARAMAHRGPDDEGFHLAGNVGLAHRRLAIIDLDRGHQPLYNEDRSVALVLNGEIYNYRELAAGLEARGHCLATRSDTETIVHLYEERGEAVVEDLRGMFAFALWDERRRCLVVARDRLGIKPLYYFAGPGRLVFASEIKALLEVPGVPREVDPEALDLYLSLRYVPGPRTLFRGIRKLPPGHLMTWDEGGLRVRRYWELPLPDGEPVRPAEARRRFEELFYETVGMHLMSEVPLGVFLSGGLDSTAVLAAVSRLGARSAAGGGAERIRTFTVGYAPPPGTRPEPDEAAADELGYARLAAEAFGADHHELRLTDVDFRDFLVDLAWHLDEPVADPACVPLYFISRLARDRVTVVLSGEGADEILGGYAIYRRMLGLERAYRAVGRPLGALLPFAARRLPGARLRHWAGLAALPLERRYRGVCRGFLPETKGALLGCPAVARRDAGPEAVFAEHFRAFSGAPPLERMLYADVKTWLADDLLVKADKMTMANSQELRVPFLDHRLVELAARLPSGLKVAGGQGKLLLREAMRGVVPRAILERPKKGFPVPTVPLLRRLGETSRELLLGRGSACRAWFDSDVVRRLLDEHRRGAARWDREIWCLLAFELWHGVFLDGRFEPSRRAAERPAGPVPAQRAARAG